MRPEPKTTRSLNNNWQLSLTTFDLLSDFVILFKNDPLVGFGKKIDFKRIEKTE